MINHYDLGFVVALEKAEYLVIFFWDNVIGLKSWEKIKALFISLEPTEDSEIRLKLLSKLKTLIIIEIGTGKHNLSILLKQIIIRKWLIGEYTKPPDKRLKWENKFPKLKSLTRIKIKDVK